jgi:hydroxymethylpyrimidine/phosphomethylpyrimidine kinase
MSCAIDGEQTISVVSGTKFAFTSTQSGTTTGSGCSLSSATATGPTKDYLFFGTNQPEAYIVGTNPASYCKQMI